ncbi:MAG TPA: hypothetical protein PLI05_11220 [Methanotrichaceae archaeon]|nr:hypothetical protein [Methanotrichaceae archaeon]HQF17622.1 hypothetical protein [Methanotrichaceae archaeon]HQI92210.1 hypothetical protein [Methanotrichaceae archaeon]
MSDKKRTVKRKSPRKTRPERAAPAEDLGRLGDTDERTILPKRLLIGDFVLDAVSYNDLSRERTARLPSGLSGTAWLRLGCIRGNMRILDIRDCSLATRTVLIRNRREIVLAVAHPQTQVSLQEALKYRPDAAIGQSLDIPAEILPAPAKEEGVLVAFEYSRAEPAGRSRDTVRIVEGKAWYPDLSKKDEPLKVQYEGFTLIIKALLVTPEGGRATIDLQLPDCLSDRDTCGPAMLALGEVDFSPTCEFSSQSTEGTFGPWIMPVSGLVVSGKGFVAQFPAPSGTPSLVNPFRGLMLAAGEATGKDLIPAESNTGYLAGLYTFSSATVTSQGFCGSLTLASPVSFDAANPRGYSITANAAKIKISQCRISSGSIDDGVVELPAKAVCRGSGSGRVKARYSSLNIDSEMDLSGEVHFDKSSICWGQLSDPARQIAAWGATLTDIGYLYLPNGPRSSYCPDQGSGFKAISISYPIIPKLKAAGIAGITVLDLSDVQVHSMDRKGGRNNPISFPYIDGWIRIVSSGIDGQILAIERLGEDYNLGNPSRRGYLAQVPFTSSLGPLEKGMMLGCFISSAVCDCDLRGRLELPEPCGFPLRFTNMMATSTADLIGGDIRLENPTTTYDYWKVELVPMGTSDLGVLSIRTGRIILTAAGIWEKLHFAEPFRVTWEEIFPTGNIGEIFFSFNSFGQMFDKMPFSAHHLKLSEYRAGATDGYLFAAGTVHFDFFGPVYANIRDARNDAQPNTPHFGRLVTVPEAGENGWEPTNLSIRGEWNASRATFVYPDKDMDYNQAAQHGFIGSGTASLSFINSPHLESRVEIHSDAIDIRISTKMTHEVDVGLYARLGGISELCGCARIEGALLKQISLHGWLERCVATGTGILAPKAGAVVETLISVTPTSCTYAASGVMTISIGGADVDASGSAFLYIDHATKTAEGQFDGRIDCNSAMVALQGRGQVTWYISPTVLAFQGSIMVAVNCWTGGIEMEGGIFLGYNVPKSQAWVLQKASPHYGISDYLLPDTLTGIYGYGRIAFGVNFYVFGGGVEIFVGLGGFMDTPAGYSSDIDTTGYLLPYFLGRGGFYLHGEILGGLVSAEGWATLQLIEPSLNFEGSLGLRGCVLWVLCASVSVTAGISSRGEFYLE